MAVTYKSSSSNARAASSFNVSHLEKLPRELLYKILECVPPSPYRSPYPAMPQNPNKKLIGCEVGLHSSLKASRTLYNHGLPIFYECPKIASWDAFDDFLSIMKSNPNLGNLVRRLDLRLLEPRRATEGAKYSALPLTELLSYTPQLRELFITQNSGVEVDESVLRVILLELPHLHHLEVRGCNRPQFQESFSALMSSETRPKFAPISTLSFRGCNSISSEDIGKLLHNLPRLRNLDVSYTTIECAALSEIPTIARLLELNVSHCPNLVGTDLAAFLSTHPAVTGSIQSLNLATTPEDQVLDEQDLAKIMGSLPSSIRNLNLQNSNLSNQHLTFLNKTSQTLLSLNVGSNLQMRGIESLILADTFNFDAEKEDAHNTDTFSRTNDKPAYYSVLSPMEKAVAVCKARMRINSLVQRPGRNSTQKPEMRYLDISSMPISEQCKLQSSVLLAKEVTQLEVIEISDRVVGFSNGCFEVVCRALGWKVTSVGRRCWLQRD